MAEIEFLLPTVQYGNVKVRATPEELGIGGVQDAGALGVAAAVYLNLFTQGFKAGTQIDVEYDDGGVKPPPPTPIQRVEEEAAPGDPQAAAERLADGRSPRTVDEANEMAKQVIENELGPTTELPHDTQGEAPWNSTVDVKPKPWETGKAAPTNAVKVAEIDW